MTSSDLTANLVQVCVGRLVRTLLALPELSLRCRWLSSHLKSLPLADAALLLNGLCELNERSVAAAREAMFAVVLCVVEWGDDAMVRGLLAEARASSLLSLERLLRRGPQSGRTNPQSEEISVPDYGTGREPTVGERRSMARRPSRRQLDKLLMDPHPLVVAQVLSNPMLTEDDVVRVAARRPASWTALEAISTSARWLCNQRVRLALLFNPGSPERIAVPLLALCTRQDLLSLLASTDTSNVLRATAHELLERMPPLRSPTRGVVMQ